MKDQKGNMYPGIKTKNPLAGKCLHGCSYCSTNSLMRYPVIAKKYSGEIRLERKMLTEKDRIKQNLVYCCSERSIC
jgi:hypothetical protein